MPTPLSETLWALSRDVVDACRRHEFIARLADGTLPLDTFHSYVAQDTFFLGAFARTYALALARSSRIEDIAQFVELIQGTMDELRIHRGYAAELRIPIENTKPFPETQAYTEFLLGTAWSRGIGEILAAVTPSMKLYLHIASDLAGEGLPDHQYRAWIEAYSSETFAGLVTRIEGLLDRHAEDTQAVRDAYRYAIVCERDFFTGAMRAGAGGA
jgi:thiaminase/transcriptional activator TenA